jgi:SAM-dependent methyltransferase
MFKLFGCGVLLAVVCVQAVPPQEIPQSLLGQFTNYHQIPVLLSYCNDERTEPRFFNSQLFDIYIAAAKRKEAGYNDFTDMFVYQALDELSPLIRGKEVAVMGSFTPWYESILLSYGAFPVVIDDRPIQANYPGVSYYTRAEFREKGFRKFDLVLSIDSTEHQGLGRYGDRIDPYGDLKEMSFCQSLLRPGGTLLLAVPIARDAIVWNAHRVYGPIRLKMLFQNWNIERTFGFDESLFSAQPLYFSRPLFMLRSAFDMRKGEQPAIFPKPFVVGQLAGQLGNQLFQVASVLAYAWDYDYNAYFPCLNITTESAKVLKFAEHRDTIFSFLNTSLPPRPIRSHYKDIAPAALHSLPRGQDFMLSGSLQSRFYFDHYRERLRELFKPSPEIMYSLERKYPDLLAAPNTVSVHVRTWDEESHFIKGFYFVGMEYYRQAMDLFPEDSLFVIFSDRINWCKHHFSIFNKKFVFIEGNNELEDLFLMSKMRNHIIVNSSFGWWGAYLDPNPNKIVVTPPTWYDPKKYNCPQEFHIFPEWIQVVPNYEEPYPTDIRDYDRHSCSADTQ